MRQIPIQREEIIDRARVARLQGWAIAIFGLIVVVGLVYVPLQGLGVVPAPADGMTGAMTLEAGLTEAFFPQIDSISGRYLVPFLARLVVTAAVVLLLVRNYFSGATSTNPKS